ncbi:RNA-directed DNA polymerase, eukaryota, nucleotide-binding alpha-beta plait domain protein [Tanacetum coccineum]
MGVDDWTEVKRKNRGFISKEDDLAKVSISIYVTNFPDYCTAKDLFQSCKVYGHVVDSYIPIKRSKSGKRFGFVRFINVFSVERLVSNLCTLWIGKLRLHANTTRFQRPPVKPIISAPVRENVKNSQTHSGKRQNQERVPFPKQSNFGGSYANVVKDYNSQISNSAPIVKSPTVVLDEDCYIPRDLSLHVMGKVKDASSITRLQNTLLKEGFPDVHLSYLGGLWVVLELASSEIKSKLLNHTGVKSWFAKIQDAIPDFVCEDRIVWVDIEGIPMNLWSRQTFEKIGNIWGEVLDIEENSCSSFARKRLCIRTKKPDNILESFKIVFKGKLYFGRAKELFVWNPSIKNYDSSSSSDDEDSSDDNSVRDSLSKCDVQEFENREEHVSETSFGDKFEPLNTRLNSGDVKEAEISSADPFELYKLLQKNNKETKEASDPSLLNLYGFTCMSSQNSKQSYASAKDVHSISDKKKVSSPKCNSKVFNVPLENSKDDKPSNEDSFIVSNKKGNGGSILDALDDMIRIGQSMGYDMEGCSQDIERIIGLQGGNGFAAALAVLVTGASQSRQHESHHRFFPVDTSLIHIESRKSPTKSLFDVGSRRISIFTVNTKEYHSDVLAIITRIMRRT